MSGRYPLIDYGTQHAEDVADYIRGRRDSLLDRLRRHRWERFAAGEPQPDWPQLRRVEVSPQTDDVDTLGITPDDLDRQRAEERQQHTERARQRRTVHIDDKPFDLDDGFTSLRAALDDSLDRTPGFLTTPPKFTAPSKNRRSAGPGWPDRRRGGVGGGFASELSSPQKLGVGFTGEAVGAAEVAGGDDFQVHCQWCDQMVGGRVEVEGDAGEPGVEGEEPEFVEVLEETRDTVTVPRVRGIVEDLPIGTSNRLVSTSVGGLGVERQVPATCAGRIPGCRRTAESAPAAAAAS
jgi:hypothetical protein